jgi:hypothetical protein
MSVSEFVTENATGLSAVAKGNLSNSDIATSILYLYNTFRPEFETSKEAFLQRALHYIARQASTTPDDFEADFPGYVVHHDQTRLDKPVSHSYLYNKWQAAQAEAQSVLDAEADLFN